MPRLSRVSALSARRRCTSAFQETWLAPTARCHRQWHSTAASSPCAGAAATPAARHADPCPEAAPCSTQVLSSHSCPTAAVLVDTSDSALVTLPYCLADVQEKVRAQLRLLLIQRLLAPLVTESLMNLFGEQPREGSSDIHAGGSGDAAAMASTVVHSVTQSPSTLRYLAFSHKNPRLRHPSWAPLWAASPQSNTPSTSSCTPSVELNVEIHADAKRPDEAAVDAFDVRVTLVEQDAAETLVRPCLGEVAPLLGSHMCGSFRAVTTAAHSAMSATLSSPTTAAEVLSAKPAAPSPLPKPSFTAVTYWECCRVDSYLPSYVQVQAAVRHLLLRRRPTADFTANARSAVPTAFVSVPQLPPARPLALVAVVAPDHLTALYSEFVDMLEREGRQRLHQQQGGATCGGPVHLLLFNSKGLVRKNAAV
ncbi:hypothetical protein IOCL2690_000387500 [Leishmania lindenbergi]|uniref:ARP2/3 complex subunit n=1 Tax=Leishmania lindenbergi TaxID=651832 RepID=A0AAW3AGD2_9TRYP